MSPRSTGENYMEFDSGGVKKKKSQSQLCLEIKMK